MSAKGQVEISGEVIEGCCRNDKKCQKIVYETYYKSMYAICLRYSSNADEAKDLLHEGFMKLFKNISSFSGTSSFSAWIKRLFTNNCIDYVRSAYKKYIHYFEEIYTEETNEMMYEEEEEISQKAVLEAMSKLRPDYKIVLNLYAIENLSHSEIAQELGIEESSSRSKLSRARAALKKLLNIG
ncbi:MAG: sigma-70 family RNA polymerase sigma factor [Flavobacteriales bacterium]|nr:sigma-70 family RNA polymerase sigma factor [Flavobacteriales bacterium]